jgi:hypothetical protein
VPDGSAWNATNAPHLISSLDWCVYMVTICAALGENTASCRHTTLGKLLRTPIPLQGALFTQQQRTKQLGVRVHCLHSPFCQMSGKASLQASYAGSYIACGTIDASTIDTDACLVSKSRSETKKLVSFHQYLMYTRAMMVQEAHKPWAAVQQRT